MKKIKIFKGESDRRAALNLKKRELRQIFNFNTGGFSALIESLINEEPEAETLEILKLEDNMSRKQYRSFCELVESEKLFQIKREIHEIKTFMWQDELKLLEREELCQLFNSFSFDPALLINIIIQEIQIVDSLNNTINEEEHDALVNLLESDELIQIKRNFWSIKKMKDFSNKVEEKINSYKKQMEEMFEEIAADTSDLVNAILDGEQESGVMMQMRIQEYQKMQQIIKSKQFWQIKECIRIENERENKCLLQFNERREKITKKLKPYQINFKQLLNMLLQGKQTAEFQRDLKQIMSFKHFKELSAIIQSESAIISEIINKSSSNQHFEVEKSKQLRGMLDKFQSKEIQELISAILYQTPEDQIFKNLSLKLICHDFHQLQAIMKSEQLDSIRKSIQIWRNNERQRSELSQIFKSFNIDSRKLVEAIISESAVLIVEAFDRLSEQMVAKEYNMLVRFLGGLTKEKCNQNQNGKTILPHLNEIDEMDRIFSSVPLDVINSALGALSSQNRISVFWENRSPIIPKKEELIFWNQQLEQTIAELIKKNGEQQRQIYQLKHKLDEQILKIEVQIEVKKQSQKITQSSLRLPNMTIQNEPTQILLKQKHQYLEQQIAEFVLKIHGLEIQKVKCKQEEEILKSKQKEQLLQRASQIKQEGITAYESYNYFQALNSFGRCLLIQMQAVGKGAIETAHTLYWIGQTYFCQDNYLKAIEFQKESIGIYQAHEERSYGYAAALNAMGLCYWEMKDSKSAAPFFEKVLLYDEKFNEAERAKSSALNLALSLRQLGENDRVKKLIKKYQLKMQDLEESEDIQSDDY